MTLRARRAALWCWLELEGTDARFSDNFVHLRPGRAAQVRVRPARPLSPPRFRQALRVRSLVDTFAHVRERPAPGGRNPTGDDGRNA